MATRVVDGDYGGGLGRRRGGGGRRRLGLGLGCGVAKASSAFGLTHAPLYRLSIPKGWPAYIPPSITRGVRVRVGTLLPLYQNTLGVEYLTRIPPPSGVPT
jgi:hypothetical protein